MAISAVRIDERVAGVEVTDAELIVRLRDGRRLAAPPAPAAAPSPPKPPRITEMKLRFMPLHMM